MVRARSDQPEHIVRAITDTRHAVKVTIMGRNSDTELGTAALPIRPWAELWKLAGSG